MPPPLCCTRRRRVDSHHHSVDWLATGGAVDVWRHAELVSAGVRAVHGIVTAKSWRYSTRLAVGRQTDRQKTSRLATLRVVPDLFHIIPFERHYDGDNSQDDEDNDTASNQVALCEAAAYFVLTPHITETLLQAPRVRIILLRSSSARRQGTREKTLMRQRRPHAGTVLYSAHADMRRHAPTRNTGPSSG